jgi:hypothetical protein
MMKNIKTAKVKRETTILSTFSLNLVITPRTSKQCTQSRQSLRVAPAAVAATVLGVMELGAVPPALVQAMLPLESRRRPQAVVLE